MTTLVGFASLATSAVAPVRALGLWAALGLALMTVAALVVYPALLAAGRPRRTTGAFERRFRRLGRRWGEAVVRRRGAVLIVALVASGVAAFGLPRLWVESNALHYLAPDHPARATIEELEDRGVGMATVELLVRAADGAPGFESVERLSRLVDLAFAIEDGGEIEADGAIEDGGEPRVFGVASAATLLDAASRHAPRARQAVLDELLARGELRRFLDPERRTARISVFVETVGFDRLEPLLERLRRAARDVFSDDGTSVETTAAETTAVEITGEYPLLLEAQRQLLATLGWSLSVTVLVIGLILRLLLPGTRLTLLAMLPNLWPVLGVLGFMGWAGIPLDIATVMVASIVVGLAVDDSIHTLAHFRCLAPRHGADEAVAATLGITAPAYLLTGLVLSAGFGVCGLSDFAPTARFGALSAVAIVLAVVGDLLLLPALLSLTPSSTLRRWRDSVDGPPTAGRDALP